MIYLAPNSFARIKFFSLRSIAITFTPIVLRVCTTNNPTVPQPTTAAVSPGFILDFLTACIATVVGSKREISSGLMLSGTQIRLFIGHVIYS